MAHEVTNCVVIDLIDISNIYLYLCQNWHLKQLRVDITFLHNGKDMTFTEKILNKKRVEGIYNFMLDRWTCGCLKVIITETDGP